jgi:hypothetical protein
MSNDENITSLAALFTRVFWMMIGPLSLVLLAFTIVRIGSGWFTWADGGYLAVLAGMLYARWWEFRTGRAKTTEGQPATEQDLRSYAQQASGLALAMWVAANVVGNHVLQR